MTSLQELSNRYGGAPFVRYDRATGFRVAVNVTDPADRQRCIDLGILLVTLAVSA